jgi:hypothetical protein
MNEIRPFRTFPFLHFSGGMSHKRLLRSLACEDTPKFAMYTFDEELESVRFFKMNITGPRLIVGGRR